MRQIEYIRQSIDQLNADRAAVPEAFAKEAREIDAAIEALILSSDKGAQIVALRMKKEDARTRHTARASALSGRIEALTDLFNRYHQNPVPPGTTVHGIDVSVLDWETRAKIMAGDADTIAVFGGAIAPPEQPDPPEQPGPPAVEPGKIIRRRQPAVGS
jgi:hypothetical protein